MKTYYDTGVILKLYTEEPESDAARTFIIKRKEALYLSSLHIAECTSALRLKHFRGECEAGQVARALTHLEEDFRVGVLKALPVDWDEAWQRCRNLSDAHAGETGCRTLDALHVACAVLASAAEFITSDRRQLALGRLTGLQVWLLRSTAVPISAKGFSGANGCRPTQVARLSSSWRIANMLSRGRRPRMSCTAPRMEIAQSREASLCVGKTSASRAP